MTRTVYTESTALFAVLVIFLYGGATIHNFMFAMLVALQAAVILPFACRPDVD